MIRLLLVLVVCAACDAATLPSPDAAPTGSASRKFVHPLPNCPDEDPLYNCAPSLELCDASDRAEILVTDIVNIGTYDDGNAMIRTTFPVADVPRDIAFTYQSIDVLVDDWLGWEWTLDPAPMYSSCD